MDLATDPNVNKFIEDQLLLYGLFSFLYVKEDLRNNIEFKVSLNGLSKYLDVSIGVNGYDLRGKISKFTKMYGVIDNIGVFPLMEIQEQLDTLIIRSEYLHRVSNLILNEAFNKYGERAKYLNTQVFTDILSERNKSAALIAIELVSLIARSKRNTAHISLKTLITRVPRLTAIILSDNDTSYKNKQLNRAFQPVIEILKRRSTIFEDLIDLRIQFPKIKFSNLDAVIQISYKAFSKNKLRRE